MNIGIFDSGLGGLLIFKKLTKKFPKYNFVYLGDVKRLPYGNRSDETIFNFTRQAVEYLFNEENCKLVILACNTASAKALRRIQQDIIPEYYPGRRVLGVIIPTAEEAVKNNKHENKEKKIGVLATKATVYSGTYKREIQKIDCRAKVFEVAAPSLVTLIENGEINYTEPILRKYLKPILGKKIDTLILGCTHYPLVQKKIKKICGKNIKIISQDKIIPEKLLDYLERHPEIDDKLEKKGKRKILVTEETENYKRIAKRWFSGSELLIKIDID